MRAAYFWSFQPVTLTTHLHLLYKAAGWSVRQRLYQMCGVWHFWVPGDQVISVSMKDDRRLIGLVLLRVTFAVNETSGSPELGQQCGELLIQPAGAPCRFYQ